jgi:mRNA interferase MazF
MIMKQFDIFLADLSPGFGTESGKIRPVVIVQNNFIIREGHESTVVCPLTTKLTSGTKILRIRVPASQSNLIQDSEILMDQVRVIDNKRFIRYIGSLDEKTALQVKESLGIVLDL